MNEHPTLEQLSAYFEAPEQADLTVQEHVTGCDVCSAYGGLFREVEEEISELAVVDAPPASWESIASRLEHDGLVKQAPSGWSRLKRGLLSGWGMPQLAAATAVLVVVFLGGILTGRVTTDVDGMARGLPRTLTALLPDDSPAELDPVAARAALDALLETSKTALMQDPNNALLNSFAFEVEHRRREIDERIRGTEADTISPSRRQALHDSVVGEARDALRTLETFGGKSQADGLPSRGLGATPIGTLGLRLEPLAPELAEYFPGTEEGLLILDVLEGGPAGSVGLMPGDVIIEAAGDSVRTIEDLIGRLTTPVAERDSIELTWVRRGRTMSGTVRISPRS